jgi:hypothetical protein
MKASIAGVGPVIGPFQLQGLDDLVAHGQLTRNPSRILELVVGDCF